MLGANLSKLKQDELKSIAKNYNLHLSGTKPILIARIFKNILNLLLKANRFNTKMQIHLYQRHGANYPHGHSEVLTMNTNVLKILG